MQDNHISVFKREFPICKVAQGQIGDTPFLSKGNPLSGTVIVKRK